VQLFAAVHIDDIAVILYAGAGLSLEYKAEVAPHMSALGGKADMTLRRNPLSRSQLE